MSLALVKRTADAEYASSPAGRHNFLFGQIELNLEEARAINQRRSEIARDVPTKSLAVFGAWVTMIGVMKAGYALQLAAVSPLFPVVGVVLCIFYLLRDATLAKQAAMHVWAAMKIERLLMDERVVLDFCAGHVQGAAHVSSDPTAIEDAISAPMMVFIIILWVEVFFANLLHLPSLPGL